MADREACLLRWSLPGGKVWVPTWFLPRCPVSRPVSSDACGAPRSVHLELWLGVLEGLWVPVRVPTSGLTPAQVLTPPPFAGGHFSYSGW